MTPSVIEPTTFRLKAKYLNELPYGVPHSNGTARMKHVKTGFFMVVHVMTTSGLMVLKQPKLLLSNKSSNVSAAQLSLNFLTKQNQQPTRGSQYCTFCLCTKQLYAVRTF
jgi:hypothetical protein